MNFRSLSSNLCISLCLVLSISSFAHAEVTEVSLQHFANVYAHLYQSPYKEVAYKPQSVNPKELTSILLKSYQDSTDYTTLSSELRTGLNTNLTPDTELIPLLQNNGLSKADVDELLYSIANNPVYLKKFMGYFKGTAEAQKLAELTRDVPNFCDLLPDKTHRRAMQVIMAELKTKSSFVFFGQPKKSVASSGAPVRLVPMGLGSGSFQPVRQAASEQPSISWIIRSPVR